MKKLIACALIACALIAASVLLAGCGKKVDSRSDHTDLESSEPAPGNLRVWTRPVYVFTDPKNQCEYFIVPYRGESIGFTPRLDPSGRPLCGKSSAP